ncbi:MAG TPA: SDR family oxidoreductase [Roseiarcus sp.]|nr:SDR family oxidoreductase [Roseiarcus sp.]
MTYAVTGASGQLGRLVVERLKAKAPASEIAALARSPEKAADLGVPVRQADYTKPDTLEKALAGVDVLLLISSSEIGQRAPQHHNVLQAAKAAGVKRVVYTSLLRADTSPLSLAPEHAETEKELKGLGIPFTILRNGWYTENNTGFVKGAVAGGALIGAAGEGRISGATRADFADAAVVALADASHAGKTYELAGDNAYTLADLAAEISRQTGKSIPYKNLSAADYAKALTGFGLPGSIAEALAGWDALVPKGVLFDDGKALSRLIGRPTTPLSTAVAAALA